MPQSPHQTHAHDPTALPARVAPAMNAMLETLPGLSALMFISREGQLEVAMGEHRDQMTSLASFAIGALELSTRLADEAGAGELGCLVLRASQGHLAIHTVGYDHLLCALADDATALGLLVHELEWCITQWNDPNGEA